MEPTQHPFEQTEYADETFKALDLTRLQLEGRRFSDCRFVSCDFSEAQLRRCRFLDCEFTQCNLSLAKLTATAFRSVRFVDCKMIGVNWANADWQRIKVNAPIGFERCVLNDSSFFGLYLRELKLIECRAHDVDFADAQCEEADFSYSDLTNSQFRNTNLAGADFSEARNYRIDVMQNHITKAKFSLPEAVALLEGLDIVLQD